MEAQAMGLPCVSTWHSGIPEVIPRANQYLLAKEGDPMSIADRMRLVMESPLARLHQIAERGRAKIEREFNLEKEVRALQQCYARSTSEHKDRKV